jgi:predicted murein hydrolase (TIGR00659 family)
MKELIENSVFFGVLITLGTYWIGMLLKKRFKSALVNPLLISIVLITIFLLVFNVDYSTYEHGASCITYLLTPATVCLALPLYQQYEVLKKNYKALMLGITAGVLSSLGCILAMAAIFVFNHDIYVTLLPKSITTAIGIGISKELGGYVPITVASIVITGVLGNIFAEHILKMFRITEPIAKGIAIGTSAHAMGTAKAMEIGAVEGAMSSLSIVVAGIMTVAGASIFAQMW